MKDGRLSLPYLTFWEPAVGPAALVVWLCTSGATDLRMELSVLPAEPDEAPNAP